jgi:hypothetical protein
MFSVENAGTSSEVKIGEQEKFIGTLFLFQTLEKFN